MPTVQNVVSTLRTGHASLCDIPYRQHLFHLTRSVAAKQLRDTGCCSAARLPVTAPQHQRTEATLAQALVLALTRASVTMQLRSFGIIFDHACGQIMDTGATGVTALISV